MPIAQNPPDETQRFELESCPPDGFVVLRRLTYGQTIKRRALTKLSMNMDKGQKDFNGEMALASVEINNYEFATCVVDHNLERLDGTKFNFSNPVELQYLDPRVGAEIELHMDEMNNFEKTQGESIPALK